MDINKIDRKRVLIVGDYKNEKAIASSLIKRGCSVTVINDNSEECERLAEIKGLNGFWYFSLAVKDKAPSVLP